MQSINTQKGCLPDTSFPKPQRCASWSYFPVEMIEAPKRYISQGDIRVASNTKPLTDLGVMAHNSRAELAESLLPPGKTIKDKTGDLWEADDDQHDKFGNGLKQEVDRGSTSDREKGIIESISGVINNNYMTHCDKQKRLLDLIKRYANGGKNYLEQIPPYLWNEDIVIAASVDDEDSVSVYLDYMIGNYDFKYNTLANNISWGFIKRFIDAIYKEGLGKKILCYHMLFKTLSRSLIGGFVPKEIWMLGCKFLPSVCSYLPEKFLTQEMLDVLKKSGGSEYDASLFSCATAEDICFSNSGGLRYYPRSVTAHI